MTTTFNKDNLPYDVDSLPHFYKFKPTPMFHLCVTKGPVVVETLEQPITLNEGWVGWIAIDDQGYPYPIAESVHNTTYKMAIPSKSDYDGTVYC